MFNKIFGIVISQVPPFFLILALFGHSVEANKAVNQPSSSRNQDSRTFSRNVETPRIFSTRITISFTYLFPFFFRYCDRSFNSLHFSLIWRVLATLPVLIRKTLLEFGQLRPPLRNFPYKISRKCFPLNEIST